jgi:2'-5' RNA ligase superfamily protein
MSEPTQTAVIVPVAAAEGVVAGHRRRLDRAAAWGVPAHVTVLFPFVPPAEVGAGVIDALASLLATVDPFDCTFASCGWFGEDVVWLAPEPAERFRELTRAVVERFPGHLPYGGEFEDIVPHLTVGEARLGTVEDLRAVEAEVSRALPITARIDHALVMEGAERPDSWRTLARLPLARSRSGRA